MKFAGAMSSVRVEKNVLHCPQCRSTLQVGRGLCLNCLLSRGFGEETHDNETLDTVLEEIDVRDADWRLGNYQILEEIGRGGMGVIYRARQRHSRRIVALKRVLAYHSDSRETLSRFRREAEAAASLDHPNILPIYEVGESDDGLPFFSMKFAAGGSLLDNLVIFSADRRRAVALMAKVCRAVQHAHRQGILHRDLKPGNILLDGSGEPLVSDFGLAKWLDASSDVTRTLTVFGTPGYIAPEQVAGPAANLKPTADVYSLGAILYDLLAGRPPFLGEHALAVIRQAAEKPAPKLRSIVSGIDRDVETICARCLEREQSVRYSSAGDLAQDLERWLEGRTIIARPVSPPTRIWRWARRNRALSASIGCSLLLGIAAAGWQIQTWRLRTTFREEMLATHSIAIVPFLNLDTGTADTAVTADVAATLRSRMSNIGPARIITSTKPSAKWTGTGARAEVRLAARETNCRAVLAGMFRRVGEQTRVSLHLVGQDGNDVLQNWTLKIGEPKDAEQALTATDVSALIYKTLASETQTAANRNDPVIVDATARGYFNAGRSLLDRRTIPDIDRAINCFEGAIQAAPKSTMARSYLALAYMGRNFLSEDPAYTEKAYRSANEALQISSDDSSAHRALCALDISIGHFDEALEHALRALESGDPSERALGQIGFIWEQLGRPDKAIQWFAKAKVSETQLADYDAMLGDAWMLLTEDDKARQAYETSANFRPDLPEGWLGLCHLKLLRGEVDEARALFQKHAAEYQSFHTAKPFEAQIEFFSRNFPAAKSLYGEIRRADPHGFGAQQYGAVSQASALARLGIAEGDFQFAKQLADEAFKNDEAQVSRSPRYAEALYRLAADQAIKKNTNAAIQSLRASVDAGWLDYRSLRLDPRFDFVSSDSRFQQILNDLMKSVADLKRQALAEQIARENER